MSFFGRILGHRSGPVDPEGWEVGDWAECVNLGQWFVWPELRPGDGPRHGRIGQVTGVRVIAVGRARILALSFAAWPGSFFAASQFHKLNPRADDAIAAEAGFTELVRRKPAPAMPRETIWEWQ